MQELLENIIFELLNCNNLKYKYIGMQLAREFTKKNIDFDKRNKKIEAIKEKLYTILLDSISENVALVLRNNTILINALATRLRKATGWQMSPNGTFTKKDYRYSYIISRNEEGYFVHPRKNYELGKVEACFYNNYQQELNIIHKAMSDNERILGAIPCFSTGKVSEKLLSMIVEFINNKDKIKEVKKIYTKNRNK